MLTTTTCAHTAGRTFFAGKKSVPLAIQNLIGHKSYMVRSVNERSNCSIPACQRFSRRLSGLTCKGSLVQVHSSTPEKTVKPQGFSLKGTKIDQWVKAGTGQEKIRSSKRWSDFSLYTDENSSEVTTISELFGFYEFIFGVIPMLSSSSASSLRLWTFSFLYAFLR